MTIKEILERKAAIEEPEWEPLWDYAKYVFDLAAKEPRSILCGLDSVFGTLEDFCEAKAITPSPLCAYMFEGKGALLSQAKLPRYHAREWNELFPQPLRMTTDKVPDVLLEYKRFLQERDARFDWEALSFLNEYISPDDDEESSE